MTGGLGDAGITLVAVHAHPDDETLATGLALAHHVLSGSDVHVITATLGEEGEVIPAELAHLESSAELGPYRAGELRAAMSTLGVQHHYLAPSATGGMPRWRDSGMEGSAAARHPRAFAAADVREAAAALAEQLRAIAPDVLLTYDPQGGYGHPDHIKTHEASVAALRMLGSAHAPRMYVAAQPRSWVVQDRQWLRDHVPPASGLTLLADDAPFPPSVCVDEEVSYRIVDAAAAALRTQALRHHGTQVTVYSVQGLAGYFALSNDIAARLADREGYREWAMDD